MVTHPSLPVQIDRGADRATPRPIRARSTTRFVPGTVGHISTEMFARNAGITLTKIPYKGNGDAIANLLGGHVQMMFISILPVIGQIQGGKLNALAVASPERVVAHSGRADDFGIGLPGFSAVISYGLAAPAGTPRAIVERLNKELRVALADPVLRKRLDAKAARSCQARRTTTPP